MIAKQSSQPGDVVLPKINTLAKGVPNSSQGTETIREDDEDLF